VIGWGAGSVEGVWAGDGVDEGAAGIQKEGEG